MNVFVSVAGAREPMSPTYLQGLAHLSLGEFGVALDTAAGKHVLDYSGHEPSAISDGEGSLLRSRATADLAQDCLDLLGGLAVACEHLRGQVQHMVGKAKCDILAEALPDIQLEQCVD